MKIYFEEYEYPIALVEPHIDRHYYTETKSRNSANIPYVGYFFNVNTTNPDQSDSVFILPKVFIFENKKAFGKYNPEDIIDTTDTNNPLTEQNDKEVVFSLSTWIYRAISHYYKRCSESQAVATERIQNVVSSKGDNSETFLDIILQLLRFHKENRNLFTYISTINNSGNNKIHWAKTISKTQPTIQNGQPYYTKFQNKSKSINYDEEIIVLFYSVLDYLQQLYHFKTAHYVQYTLIPNRKIQAMIDEQKGTRLLRDIRRKYYTDELVALWKLLYVFFDQAEQIANKHYHEELLLARNFNIVFEDMIDQLIGDNRDSLPNELKEQRDGKIVDHIYKDRSLIDGSDIYFIGDSKYYKEENAIGTHSIYKQFTYAKNVIQYNIDIFNEQKHHSKQELGSLRYRDELTEGYNITPNFFIRGVINKDQYSYSEPQLEKEKQSSKLPTNIHFKNRLFDRDTLILQTYNINFLFVLSAYVVGENDNNFRQRIRTAFRSDLIALFNSRYDFYKVTPTIAITDFVDKYFRQFNGKMYRATDTDKHIWFAFEKVAKDTALLLSEIKPDSIIEKTELSNI